MIRVIGEKIIVKPGEIDTPIIIPDSVKEFPTKGEVIAIGNACPDWCDFEEGDTVIWFSHAGSWMEYEGKSDKYLVIRPNDVIGVEKKELVLN